MKYIDSEKLIAELKRKIGSIENCPFQLASFGEERKSEGELIAYKDALFLITSLQQEQPEVDLEKEITKWMKAGDITDTRFDDYGDSDIEITARHFYELGCSTQYQKDRGEFAKLKAKEWQDGYDEGYAKGLARKEGAK